MLHRPHKFLLILIASLALAVSAGAQTLDSQTLSNIKRETTRLLLEKDVGEVAHQLARERAATTIVPLLRRLSIFARAGHRARVLQTINQLAEASDLPPLSHRWLVAQAVKEFIGGDDLAALRAYYERIMPTDAASAESFLRLWEKEGEAKELDAWLAQRSTQHVEWIRFRIYWRVKLGTLDELLDALAADVKAHPEDRARVSIYLEANRAANKPQDVSWLEDAIAPRLAFELYELGALLKMDAPESAARLLERSLAQPFTEQDMRLIAEREMPRYQIPPRVKNWDKQLRLWTKRHLAEIYLEIDQPQVAQKFIEELVAMKGDDDISTEDVHNLAGMVQAQSGMRVVEAKILRDETTERESISYWLERAQYYTGRKEYDAVMETYRQALIHLPFKAQDRESLGTRLTLLNAFTLFATSRDAFEDGKQQERRAEIKQILRREFTAAPLETDYAFGLARIIVDDGFAFDDLRVALFVKDKDALQRMLAARTEWNSEERWLIENVVCRENVSPGSRANFWTQLEALAKNGAPSRAYQLADVMLTWDEARRAIPLLIGYLNQIREQRDEDAGFKEGQALSALLSAYLGAGNWQAAEKLLFKRDDLDENQLLYDLTRISFVATGKGALHAVVRLWRMKSNLDRRHLDGLAQLATTKAKEPLRELYIEIKKKDPLSFVPEVALKVLQ
jgi:tetratricopeptide (TPR) repeat protein